MHGAWDGVPGSWFCEGAADRVRDRTPGRSPPSSGLVTVSSAPTVVYISPKSGSAIAIASARLPGGAGLGSPFGAGAHLSGDWSWVPYMGGVLFCLLVAGFCVLRIVKGVAR